MREDFAAGQTFSAEVQDSAAFVQEVDNLVVILYESGALDDAADLDVMVTSLERLLEDNGAYEEGKGTALFKTPPCPSPMSRAQVLP